MRISASDQVQDWLRSLSPDAKRRVRLALRKLARSGSGDIKPLEAELTGFYRLRVGGYRIVYSNQAGELIRLEYADLREFVYERFIHLLKKQDD